MEVDAGVECSYCKDGKVGVAAPTTTFLRFTINKEGVFEVKTHLS